MANHADPPERRSVRSFDGARIEYEVTGRGPPLVMLHGVLAGRRAFSRQLAAFAARFRLIAVSARGHDGSDLTLPENYGAGASDVDDLKAVLDAEQVDRMRLLGHSSGGATTFVFASQQPHRVSQMVLIEPTLLDLLVPPDRDLAMSLFERMAAKATAEGPLPCLVEAMDILGGDAWARLDEAARAERLRALAPIAPVLGPHMRGLLDLRVPESAIRNLRPDTLLVYGADSYRFEAAIARRIRQLRPDLRLITLEEAGHNAHRDQWGRFNDIALDFLTAEALT